MKTKKQITDYTPEEIRTFEQVSHLEKASAMIQDQVQAIRLHFQDKRGLSGNDFYKQLADYTKLTTGNYCL